MASKVKSAAGSLERLFLPRLNSIDGELKAINIRMGGFERSISESDKRTESFRSEFRAELKTMNSKLDHIYQKLDIDRSDGNRSQDERAGKGKLRVLRYEDKSIGVFSFDGLAAFQFYRPCTDDLPEL
jgi:hypothetical protein